MSLGSKILHVRRNPTSWMTFRIFLGLAGATLVIVPLSLSNSWLLAPAGLVMFLAAILLPPASRETTPEDKARELAAFIVIDGGTYQSPDPAPVPVDLYVGPERISVLDSRYNSLLVIPVDQISSAVVVEDSMGWILQILWSYQVSEFCYRGTFAERLARSAESHLTDIIQSRALTLPRSRAAGA